MIYLVALFETQNMPNGDKIFMGNVSEWWLNCEIPTQLGKLTNHQWNLSGNHNIDSQSSKSIRMAFQSTVNRPFNLPSKGTNCSRLHHCTKNEMVVTCLTFKLE